MINNTGGVGGFKPEETPKGGSAQVPTAGADGMPLPADFQLGPTLQDMKRQLVQAVGEEKGTQLYNSIMNSIMMTALQQMEQSQKSADDAAKRMRDPNA